MTVSLPARTLIVCEPSDGSRLFGDGFLIEQDDVLAGGQVADDEVTFFFGEGVATDAGYNANVG